MDPALVRRWRESREAAGARARGPAGPPDAAWSIAVSLELIDLAGRMSRESLGRRERMAEPARDAWARLRAKWGR